MLVRFRVSLKGSFGGPVMRRLWSDLSSPPPGHDTVTRSSSWPGHDAAEALGRRLTTANMLHGADLDERRCVLSAERITLAGTMRFEGVSSAGEAVGSVLAMTRWTLRIVYGHQNSGVVTAYPLPGLSLTVAEVAERRR